jgi:hypothetical protein
MMTQRPDAPADEYRPPERSLAALIDRVAAGSPLRDRAFVRRFARGLSAEDATLRLAVVDDLGLRDVVATLQLDTSVQLVVSGHLADQPGSFTWRVDARDFPDVEAWLEPRPPARERGGGNAERDSAGANDAAVDGGARARAEAEILLCTLDLSWRGRGGELRADTRGVPAGQRVVARALATVGEREEVRVSVLGRDLSVAIDDVLWDEDVPPT